MKHEMDVIDIDIDPPSPISEAEALRQRMSQLGRSRSPAKLATAKANLAKAQAARASSRLNLIRAARAVQDGMSLREAAVKIGKCRYARLKQFIKTGKHL